MALAHAIAILRRPRLTIRLPYIHETCNVKYAGESLCFCIRVKCDSIFPLFRPYAAADYEKVEKVVAAPDKCLNCLRFIDFTTQKSMVISMQLPPVRHCTGLQ